MFLHVRSGDVCTFIMFHKWLLRFVFLCACYSFVEWKKNQAAQVVHLVQDGTLCLPPQHYKPYKKTPSRPLKFLSASVKVAWGPTSSSTSCAHSRAPSCSIGVRHRTVVFTDESRFTLSTCDRRGWAWRYLVDVILPVRSAGSDGLGMQRGTLTDDCGFRETMGFTKKTKWFWYFTQSLCRCLLWMKTGHILTGAGLSYLLMVVGTFQCRAKWWKTSTDCKS